MIARQPIPFVQLLPLCGTSPSRERVQGSKRIVNSSGNQKSPKFIYGCGMLFLFSTSGLKENLNIVSQNKKVRVIIDTDAYGSYGEYISEHRTIRVYHSINSRVILEDTFANIRYHFGN